MEVTPGARRLSLPLIYASLVLAVSSIAWALPEVLSDDSLWALATGKLLGWADLIVCLAVLFQLRRRLNEVQNAHRGEPSWFSLVFTWALGPLYLQYKLNRLIPSNPALLEAGRAQP
jgi:hypothetical protein